MIIVLLSRLHETRVKLRERRTFKAVKDEVAAIAEIQKLEVQLLNGEIETRTFDLQRLEDMGTPLHSLEEIAELEQDLRHFVFYFGSNKARKLYERVRKAVSSDTAPDGRSAVANLLDGYRQSLQRQQQTIERLAQYNPDSVRN
ncbi:MAG: hypothetical protein ACJ8GN_04510 [Longimicrobiaceae bacterium]